jgi:lipoic acid synthetase
LSCGMNSERTGGMRQPPGLRAGKPSWLKRKIPSGAAYQHVHRVLGNGGLHTVCQAALCPNLGECFSRSTATFLILGDRCTRNCRFCAVIQGRPERPDPQEPARVAEAARTMKLRYVVVTSVTRDDLPDGGAGHFSDTIKEIREAIPDALVEVLVPDFQGKWDALAVVLEARPDVLSHNMETVPRLYPSVRPQAGYLRSLGLLKRAGESDAVLLTKSGLMLGLGERDQEVKGTFRDLLDAGCRILTLGQYLQPSTEHLPVERYVSPEEFSVWRQTALKMGFSEVASGPFVRSSYHAMELYENAQTWASDPQADP